RISPARYSARACSSNWRMVSIRRRASRKSNDIPISPISGVQHNPNRAISALDEGVPCHGEIFERKTVRDQRFDVDRAPRNQLQATAGNTTGVGQRPVDIE